MAEEKIRNILEKYDFRQDNDEYEWVDEFIDELVKKQKKIVLTKWKYTIGKKKYEPLL